jgi:flagellar biogenesis protein FliO
MTEGTMGGLRQISLWFPSALAPLPESELAPPGYGWTLLKLLGALLLVCALAYLALRLVRRQLTGVQPGANLRVVERCALSNRHSLWLVEAGGRFFLLGTSDAPGGGVTRLAELEGAAERPARGAPVRSFWEVLQRRGSTTSPKEGGDDPRRGQG